MPCDTAPHAQVGPLLFPTQYPSQSPGSVPARRRSQARTAAAGTYAGGVCPFNYYCPAGSYFPQPCPANTASPKSSDDMYDCKVRGARAQHPQAALVIAS